MERPWGLDGDAARRAHLADLLEFDLASSHLFPVTGEHTPERARVKMQRLVWKVFQLRMLRRPDADGRGAPAVDAIVMTLWPPTKESFVAADIGRGVVLSRHQVTSATVARLERAAAAGDVPLVAEVLDDICGRINPYV